MIVKWTSYSRAGHGEAPSQNILVVGGWRHVGKSSRKLVKWLVVVESGECLNDGSKTVLGFIAYSAVTPEVWQRFSDRLHHTLMTMAYEIKGFCFKVLWIIMTTNQMPTRHVVCAIIQNTIEMELPSLWNNATGDVLIGRCSSSDSNSWTEL